MTVVEFYKEYISNVLVLSQIQIDVLNEINIFGLIITKQPTEMKMPLLIYLIYNVIMCNPEERASFAYIDEDYETLYSITREMLETIPEDIRKNPMAYSFNNSKYPYKSIMFSDLTSLRFSKELNFQADYKSIIMDISKRTPELAIKECFSLCHTGNIIFTTNKQSVIKSFPLALYPTYDETDKTIGFSVDLENYPLKQ